MRTMNVSMAALVGACAGTVMAGDWPTWGHDATRNMATTESGMPVDFYPGDFVGASDEIDPATTKNIKWIAKQLVAVDSSSALLEQLRWITPEDIQLQSLRVLPTAIKVDGVVLERGRSGPLERINALMLELQSLQATKADGVKLVKATRSESGESAQVRFTLNWALDPAVQPSLDQLEDLGAEGMAERLRRLQQEGIAL